MLEDLRMSSHPAASLSSSLGTVPRLLEAQTLLCSSAWCRVRCSDRHRVQPVSLGAHTPHAGTTMPLGGGWMQVGSKPILVWGHELVTARREGREYQVI